MKNSTLKGMFIITTIDYNGKVRYSRSLTRIEFMYIAPMICMLSMHAAEKQILEQKVENGVVKKVLNTDRTRAII